MTFTFQKNLKTTILEKIVKPEEIHLDIKRIIESLKKKINSSVQIVVSIGIFLEVQKWHKALSDFIPQMTRYATDGRFTTHFYHLKTCYINVDRGASSALIQHVECFYKHAPMESSQAPAENKQANIARTVLKEIQKTLEAHLIALKNEAELQSERNKISLEDAILQYLNPKSDLHKTQDKQNAQDKTDLDTRVLIAQHDLKNKIEIVQTWNKQLEEDLMQLRKKYEAEVKAQQEASIKELRLINPNIDVSSLTRPKVG